MKKIIILFLFSIFAGCNGSLSQKTATPSSQTDVNDAVDKLMKAFVTVDENILQSLTADELVYGHSSGKVQNKSEFIAEILGGEPLKYVRIAIQDQTIQMAGNAAVVRHVFTSETLNTDGEPGNLRIGVMQIWQLQNGTWKLLARQAFRI